MITIEILMLIMHTVMIILGIGVGLEISYIIFNKLSVIKIIFYRKIQNIIERSFIFLFTINSTRF